MKYIVANWKSNKMLSDALEWVGTVSSKLEHSSEVTAVVCPPSVYLAEIQKQVQIGGSVLSVGSQNFSQFDFGSFTGEETAQMVGQFAKYAIIGHSERRKYFFETDESLVEKVKRGKESGLEIIFCVQDEHTPIPDGVSIVAYEPVFAIGTGSADTPENAGSVANVIKNLHNDVTVLYGGSVTAENAGGFLEQEGIDGLLIGKAALDAEEFVKIVQLV